MDEGLWVDSCCPSPTSVILPIFPLLGPPVRDTLTQPSVFSDCFLWHGHMELIENMH